MKFKTTTGAYRPEDSQINQTIKAAVALSFGDVVILAGTTQDLTQPCLTVGRSAADSTTVVGVVTTPGGIAAGEYGEMAIAGIAEVRCESAAYTVGQRLNTNGGGTGTAAAGTGAAGKGVGYVLEATTGTLITTWLMIGPA